MKQLGLVLLLLAAAGLGGGETLAQQVGAPGLRAGATDPAQRTFSAPLMHAQPKAAAAAGMPAKSAAVPAPAKSAQPSVPPPETMLALVRTNVLALDHALRSNNFAVLHTMASPFLQQRLTVEQLAQAFAGLRAQRPDLVAVAVSTPVLTAQPTVLQNGMLRLVGQFPTQSQKIRFEMLYEATRGEWRLAGMDVGAGDAPAAAAHVKANPPPNAATPVRANSTTTRQTK